MANSPQKHSGDAETSCDRHNDKRIKLDEPAPQAHPFESVDYWLQFDDDQQEEAKTDASFDSCFSQWLDSSKANETPVSSVGPSTCEAKPDIAPNANANDFFYFGSPSPDVDDALKSMNLGDPWDSKAQQQQATLFPELFPPTPQSEGTAPFYTGTPVEQLSSNPISNLSTPFLGDEEKLSLLSLALNLGPLPSSLLPSGNFNFDLASAALCRESQSPASENRNAKNGRDSLGKSTEKYPKGKSRVVDRAAHNDIERRYRTNLKCKIAELRDAIPTLGNEDEDGSGGEKGQSPSKISKVSFFSLPSALKAQFAVANR